MLSGVVIQQQTQQHNMENNFANISAECDLRDMYTLTPEEIQEANAWFDSLPELDVISGE